MVTILFDFFRLSRLIILIFMVTGWYFVLITGFDV